MKLPIHLNNVRLRNKFLILYILCVVQPILGSNFVFYRVTTENVRVQRMEDIQRALDQVRNEFRAAVEDGKAVLRGKVWERGKPEPAEWTVIGTDEVPNVVGSPGLFGNAQDAVIYYDNITIMPNSAADVASRR